MPLNTACSLEALRENIAAEMKAGKPRQQAVAIAYDTLTKACKESGQPVPKTDRADEGIGVTRYDRGSFRSPVKTQNGYLRCDGRITRTGVFEYRLADGSVRRELRMPSEVFRPDSLATFDLVPLTNEHPKVKLDAKNTRQYAAGLVQGIKRDDIFLAADVLIMDEEAIKDAEAGKTELSCGYTCDLDPTPGVTRGIPGVPDGIHYDGIQRNITGNHVAIVRKGRAGSDVSLHLDQDDAVQLDGVQPETGAEPGSAGGREMPELKEVTIDGIKFEMPADAATRLDGKLEAIRTQGEKLMENFRAETARADREKARADAAEEKLEAERKDTAEKYSEDALREMVAKRVSLERTAASILKNDELDLAKMSEADIHTAVVLKMSPAAKERLDGADSAYLSARYDAAVEAWREAEKNKPTASDRAVAGAQATSTQRHDSAAARQAMLDYHYKLGTEPLKQRLSVD